MSHAFRSFFVLPHSVGGEGGGGFPAPRSKQNKHQAFPRSADTAIRTKSDEKGHNMASVIRLSGRYLHHNEHTPPRARALSLLLPPHLHFPPVKGALNLLPCRARLFRVGARSEGGALADATSPAAAAAAAAAAAVTTATYTGCMSPSTGGKLTYPCVLEN